MVCSPIWSRSLTAGPLPPVAAQSPGIHVERLLRSGVEVTPAAIRRFLFDNQIMAKLGAGAKADKETFGGRAGYAIDGNPNTCCWPAASRPADASIRTIDDRVRRTNRDDRAAMHGQAESPAHEGDIREYSSSQ
jgi:hypothetical protein